MGRKHPADPLLRSSVIGAESPLFAPGEVEAARVVGHKPMAATSLAAHQPAAVQRVTDEQRVLALCKQAKGVTIDEAAVAMGKSSNEISGRFNKLERDGLIGKTASTRLTRRGRAADVWKAIPSEAGTT